MSPTLQPPPAPRQPPVPCLNPGLDLTLGLYTPWPSSPGASDLLRIAAVTPSPPWFFPGQGALSGGADVLTLALSSPQCGEWPLLPGGFLSCLSPSRSSSCHCLTHPLSGPCCPVSVLSLQWFFPVPCCPFCVCCCLSLCLCFSPSSLSLTVLSASVLCPSLAPSL